MSFLAGIWGKILGFGALVLGIGLVALRFVSIGAKQQAAKANEARLKTQLRIKDALTKTEKTNREATKDALDKADNNDFSGFNRKPNRVSNDRNSKT